MSSVLVFSLVVPYQMVFASNSCKQAVQEMQVASVVGQSAKLTNQLNEAKRIQKELLPELVKKCQGTICRPKSLAKIFFKILKKRVKKATPKNLKAYTAMISIMLASSGFVSFVSTKLGADYPALSSFLAIFLSSVTSVGVFVVGAPIWEPIRSSLRAVSFRMMEEARQGKHFLEDQFFKTNRTLTTNSQWSRAVYRDYLRSVMSSLYEAGRFWRESNEEAMVYQVAEVLVRVKELYPDIDPTQPLIVRSVQSAFYDGMKIPKNFSEKVLGKIESFGSEFKREDFESVLDAWLKNTNSN